MYFFDFINNGVAIRISGKASVMSEKNGKDIFIIMIKKILHGFTQDARSIMIKGGV